MRRFLDFESIEPVFRVAKTYFLTEEGTSEERAMTIFVLVNARTSLVASSRQIGVSFETIGFFDRIVRLDLVRTWRREI